MKPSPTHHRAAALVVAIVAVLALVHTAPPPVVIPAPSPTVGPPPAQVDPRTADTHALESLPGVGPALARRIVEARGTHPFTRPEDLLRVRGIGPRTLARMRARLTFSRDEATATDRGASSRPP